MARLFLHIGAHKTGTSHLQHLFHLNRKRLAQAGVIYPDIGPNDAHHALAALWMDVPGVPEQFYARHSPEALWDNLVRAHATGPGTVFLSAENFSRGFPDVVDIPDLAQRLSAFDEVRVIYTMRQQAPLVQSLWLQVAKTTKVLGLHAYIRRALETGLSGGVRIDHDGIYEWLLQGFSPDQIILQDYAQMRRAPGGVGQVFLDLMGCDLRADDLVQPPQDKSNISPDPLAFLTATQIVENAVPPADLVALVDTVLHANLPDQPRSILLWSEYTRFYKQYAPRNAMLVERVQPWQPGFTFEDPAPSPDMLYRADLGEEVWSRIAAALYARQKPKPDSTWRRLSRSGSRSGG